MHWIDFGIGISVGFIGRHLCQMALDRLSHEALKLAEEMGWSVAKFRREWHPPLGIAGRSKV